MRTCCVDQCLRRHVVACCTWEGGLELPEPHSICVQQRSMSDQMRLACEACFQDQKPSLAMPLIVDATVAIAAT